MAKMTMFILILFMAILLAGTVYAESPTVFGNSKGMVHKGSGGKSRVSPDVCKTPPETPSAPPGIPIPYPNTGMASDTTNGTKPVTADGNPVPIPKANFKASTGDESGSAGNLDLDAVKPKAAVPYSGPLHLKHIMSLVLTSPTGLMSLIALMVSFVSIGWSIHIGSRGMKAAELASLSHVVNIEQTLGQTPTALKFHGITPKEMREADIEPKELAYLLSSFTSGGIYHGTKAQKKMKTFEFGSYRYEMCQSEATRKAWPIIKRMMNPSNYRDKIDATINL